MYSNNIYVYNIISCWVCFSQIKNFLTPLEIMASLIAAVAHDLDHPGVNQPFLIATSNHLATLYEVNIDVSSLYLFFVFYFFVLYFYRTLRCWKTTTGGQQSAVFWKATSRRNSAPYDKISNRR